MFVVLSHFRIVSMFLSVLKINLAPFLQEEALSDNVMRNKMLINVGVVKGLKQSNKIGVLHTIKGKNLISPRIPSPSPIVFPCCFTQDILLNPLLILY